MDGGPRFLGSGALEGKERYRLGLYKGKHLVIMESDFISSQFKQLRESNSFINIPLCRFPSRNLHSQNYQTPL